MDGSQASIIGQHHYLSTLILTLISISIILFTFIFRAKEETAAINSTKHGLLDNVSQSSASLSTSLPPISQNIFRAKEEAAAINSTKHPLLDNVGGSVSLEMQLPKLLWLRR